MSFVLPVIERAIKSVLVWCSFTLSVFNVLPGFSSRAAWNVVCMYSVYILESVFILGFVVVFVCGCWPMSSWWECGCWQWGESFDALRPWWVIENSRTTSSPNHLALQSFKPPWSNSDLLSSTWLHYKFSLLRRMYSINQIQGIMGNMME